MSITQFLSLNKRGVRYKLMVAFSLMSIIPLLILVYIASNHIFNNRVADLAQLSIILLLTIWLSWVGYMLAKEIIFPIINLALETKIIAGGDYDSKLFVGSQDELGDIAAAVNTMSDKMRSYLGELQRYSEKTALLNVKINRKVVTITNLMRLGDIISSGAKFEQAADFATEKMAEEFYGGFCAIYLKEKTGNFALKSFSDNSGKKIVNNNISSNIGYFEKYSYNKEYIYKDSRPSKDPWQKDMEARFGDINVIVFPIRLKAMVLGVIVLGNVGEGTEFNSEDIEAIRAFEKELILGYQSSQVLEKVKSTEVVDSLTGLYTFSYLEDRMEDEISRAVYYQRPCSFILIQINDMDKYVDHYRTPKTEYVLKKVGELLNDIIPAVNKVARSEGNEFGILLPEKNKRESLIVAKDICTKIKEMKFDLKDAEQIKISAGVSENPIDGAHADQLVAKARKYAENAAGSNEGDKVSGE